MPITSEETGMLETTPEGRAEAAMAGLEPVLRETEAVVDESILGFTPSGKYSAKRLNALARAIVKMMEAADYEGVVAEEYEDVSGELPEPLVRGLVTAMRSYDDFAIAMPEEADAYEMFEISSLVDDSSLALATALLSKLIASKEFRKYLRSEEPTIAIEDEVVAEEEPVSQEEETIMDDAAVVGEEQDILDML
jgi:hypothetical protein